MACLGERLSGLFWVASAGAIICHNCVSAVSDFMVTIVLARGSTTRPASCGRDSIVAERKSG